MTSKQDQFKAEMAAIFKKYNIEMTTVEKTVGYDTYVAGVNFYSHIEVTDDKGEFSHYDVIDFDVGTWADYQNFE